MENKIIKSYLFDVSSLNDDSFNKLLGSVKQYRKDKIEKLALMKSKYLSLGVELLIRKALEDFGLDYVKTEIEIGEFGKPSFKNSKYFFNTSHSGKYAFLVISDVEVGCDIEEVKEYKPRVAERFFTEKENHYLELSNDKNDLFYRFWTLKESYVKCVGKGLGISLNSFEMDNKDGNVVVKGKEEYSFIEQDYDGYKISICLKTKEKEKYLHNTSLIEYR